MGIETPMLLDHFSGALERVRDWHGFHQMWAATLAADLNRRLPVGWFAEPNVQFQLEIDVAALESTDVAWESAVVADSAGTEPSWPLPAPTAVIDVPAWNDVVAVEIYAPDRPRRLAGAIEIVSPSNKDRPESREAFVAKCERYLQTQLGLLIVDIVTERKADLHHALLTRLDAAETTDHPGRLFACAYAPQQWGERLKLRMWHEPLNVGAALPTLPLHLLDGPMIAVDLESTYTEACRALRIPV